MIDAKRRGRGPPFYVTPLPYNDGVGEVPLERLNWLLQSVVLGFSPEPMTAAERVAYAEIKAEVEANPEVEWCPLPD